MAVPWGGGCSGRAWWGQSVVHSNLCMTFKRLKTISDGLTILSEHRNLYFTNFSFHLNLTETTGDNLDTTKVNKNVFGLDE